LLIRFSTTAKISWLFWLFKSSYPGCRQTGGYKGFAWASEFNGLEWSAGILDWTTGLEYWTGLLDWPGLLAHVYLPSYLPWAYFTIIKAVI